MSVNSFKTENFALREDGFTLLEVMVSVAILAISLLALIRFQGTTMISSRRAERITIATFLARQQMVETQLKLDEGLAKGEFPEDREESGEFEEPFEDYKWSYKIRKIELPAPVIGDEGSMQSTIGKQLTTEISRSVRELKLKVTWMEGAEEQDMELVTHWVKL